VLIAVDVSPITKLSPIAQILDFGLR
jgi:hypothetical protein